MGKIYYGNIPYSGGSGDNWEMTTDISNGTITFSGIDDTINSGGCGYEVYIKVTSSSTNKSPYASLTSVSGEGTSSMTLIYETDADNGTNTAKLRRII